MEDKPEGQPGTTSPGAAYPPPPGFRAQSEQPQPGNWPPAFFPPAAYLSPDLAVPPGDVYRIKPPPFVPGPIFYAFTLFAGLIGLYASSLPNLAEFIVLALMIGLTIGLVWLIAFTIASNDTRMHFCGSVWARWTGIPVICFACLALMMSGVPATARFELSRPALEQASVNAQAGVRYSSGWIGLMPVREVRVVGSATLFVLSGTAHWQQCGLEYGAGTADPSGWLANADETVDYGHGWWYWCTFSGGD
jgi:hypothetical protein